MRWNSNHKLLHFICNEATSALDAESEHLVQEAIEKAVVGRTVLIVAHRLSTIQRATQIVVLDNHQIVDVGSHDDLLERCSKYQDLIKRQSMMHRGGKDSLAKDVQDVDWDKVIAEDEGLMNQQRQQNMTMSNESFADAALCSACTKLDC